MLNQYSQTIKNIRQQISYSEILVEKFELNLEKEILFEPYSLNFKLIKIHF